MTVCKALTEKEVQLVLHYHANKEKTDRLSLEMNCSNAQKLSVILTLPL